MNALPPVHEQERLARLRTYGILDTDPEDTYDDLTRLAAHICGTPVAAVTLIDAHRQFFKSVLGVGTREVPREASFCTHTIGQSGILVIPDAAQDARFAGNPFVTGEPHVRFYAGAPLVTEDGHALGSLCVLDRVPRTLTPDQEAALRTLAHQVMSQMERARQVEELRRSEEKFRSIIDASPVPFCLNDEQQNITLLNAQFVRTFGYTPEDIPTLADWWPRAYPDSEYRRWVTASWQARIERAAREGAAFEPMELEVCCKDGTIRTVLAEAAALEPGFRGQHLVILQDITESRRAEESVRRSEARLVEAQHVAQIGSWEYDVVTGKSTWSAEMFRLLDLDPAAGEPDYDTNYALYHPEDAARLADYIKQAVLTGQNYKTELRRMPGDRPTQWFQAIGKVVRDAAGQVIRIAGTLQDITEQRQAEESVRRSESRLIEAQRIGGIGDWELDVAARRFTWSAEVFRLMEFDPACGVPAYDAVRARYHPDDLRERDRLFARALETGEPYQCDLRLRLPSGTPRWCHLVGRPVTDAGGRVVRVAGTAQDITERVQAEQRVRDANTVLAVQKVQLEAANAELEALATTDPLTGLLNHRAFQQRLEEATAQTARDGTALAVAMLDLDGFHYFNDVYGTAAGDSVLRRVAARLQAACGAGDAAAHFSGDEFTLLLLTDADTTLAAVEARLREALAGLSYQPAGDATVIPITASVGVALFPQKGPDRQDVVQQAEERLQRAKTGGAGEADEVRRALLGSVQGFPLLDALVAAVDNKDRYTRRHSEDVMAHCLAIAGELGLGEPERRTLAVAALLHDVGKIGVPDHILRKPGGLTAEEFEAVRQHPQMGAIIVAAVPGFEGALDAIRHHHERWDGGGYPFGLRGEESPLAARLMAVADAFSAMTTDRPYRRGMGRGEALSLLAAGAGAQWDPHCVQAFLRAQADGQAH